MMRFTVSWQLTAERQLADIWEQASDRNRVTDAANLIDEMLRYSPEDAGESREDADRVVFEEPLGVRFRVCPDDRQVLVLRVWRT